MLDIQRISVFYGAVRALDQVSLKIQPGEVAVLVGANGAGKSSLLRAISGLERIKTGEIYWGETEISKLPPHKIVSLGIIHVPEGRKIFADLTVRENLILGGFVHGIPSPQRVDQVLSFFPEIADKLDRKGGLLSGGEQQMLAVARGLMSGPELLMLDEPFMGLAPIVRERLVNILLQLKQEKQAMLVSEQNVELALALADYGYVLETGTIVMQGPTQELLSNPSFIHAYFGVDED